MNLKQITELNFGLDFNNENKCFFLTGTTVDHLSSRNLPYTENNLIENTKTLKFKDPVNEDDIKKDVLKTVIHSTLTSRNQPGMLYSSI